MHRLPKSANLVLLAMIAATMAPTSPLAAQGGLRQLVCRGKAGIDLKVHQDPSPRDSTRREVTMVLNYKRPSTAPGDAYQNLGMGECSWNPLGWSPYPVEPGYVYFDVRREAQPWSAVETRSMDTTVKAGAFFPDPISLPRYLGEPRHYWVFYVNDSTQYSLSFGAWRETAQPTFTTITGPIGTAISADARRDLRCRGGGSGLTFTRGGSAGTNLVSMTLAYRVSANVPGETGRGLDPGSCAWVDRTGMAREPARVDFTTAANAQLKQIQTGGPVDRTATAAERWPDANTIPAYLTDSNRYWTFTVTVGAPWTARTHAAWTGNLLATITSKPPSTQPQNRSLPGGIGTGYEPGKGPATTQVSGVFDIRNVKATPTLEGITIQFDAAPNSTPTVWIGTGGLTGAPGNYSMLGQNTKLSVNGGVPNGTMWRYSATATGLPRNTQYQFVVTANETNKARYNQTAGTFKTWRQTAVVRFTQMDILNDSDKIGAGDLSFRFFIAPATQVLANCNPWTACETRFDGRSWDTGTSHSLANTLTFPTAPDRIRVWVKGWDADSEDPYLVTGPGPGPASYGSTGGSDSRGDWNFSSGEFNVGANPDKQRIGIPFSLRSKDGSVFMFVVRGEIEVTRQ
jgi:hypothetical protein